MEEMVYKAYEGKHLLEIGELEDQKLGESYEKIESIIYSEYKKLQKDVNKDVHLNNAQTNTRAIKGYVMQKLKWFKAFEVLRDFLVSHKREGMDKNAFST